MGKRTGKHHYLIGQDNRSASELDLDTRLELLLEKRCMAFPSAPTPRVKNPAMNSPRADRASNGDYSATFQLDSYFIYHSRQ